MRPQGIAIALAAAVIIPIALMFPSSWRQTAPAVAAVNPTTISPLLEPDAKLYIPVEGKDVAAFVKIIRHFGWRCDSVSSIVALSAHFGADVACNHNLYSYEIKDLGGHWVATID